MYGRHGITGGNLFIIVYLLVMTNPCLRLLSTLAKDEKPIVLAIIGVTIMVVFLSTLIHGGGGAGEPIGCFASILVGLGSFAGYTLATYFAPAPSQTDLWQIIGGSILPFLMILVVWLVKLSRSS